MRFTALIFTLAIAAQPALAGFPCPSAVTDPQSQCYGVEPEPSFLQTCKGGDRQCVGKAAGTECTAPGLDGHTFPGQCYFDSEALGTCFCVDVRRGE